MAAARVRPPRSSLALAAGVLALAALAVPAHAAPPGKQYGFWSDHGDGHGEHLSAPESTLVSVAIDSIAVHDYAIKGGGAFKGAVIAADLRAMLKDGRIGRVTAVDNDINAATLPDGKTSTEGDRMNVLGSEFKAETKRLARTLAHEWMHTTQTSGTKPTLEPPAYQLGIAVSLAMRAGPGDIAIFGDSSQLVMYKKQQGGDPTTLPGSNTPSGGSKSSHGGKGKRHTIVQPDGKVSLSFDDGPVAVASPLAKHMFLAVHALDLGAIDRVMVFGADTTSPASPTGWLTVRDADSTHAFNRLDLPLAGTRHPSSAAYERATRLWYVLDTFLAGSGITVWHDTNGDSIPDTRAAAAFAGAAFPGLSTARGLALATHPIFGPGVLVSADDPGNADLTAPADPAQFLLDVNHDGVADQSIPTPLDVFIEYGPTVASAPLAGASQLDLCGEGGHTLQLWTTDATADARFELLGSGVPPSTGPATASLARAPAAGELLVAVDATANTQLAGPETVLAPLPIWSWPAAGAAAALLAGAAAAALAGRRRMEAPRR